MTFIPERWFCNLRHSYRLEPSTILNWTDEVQG